MFGKQYQGRISVIGSGHCPASDADDLNQRGLRYVGGPFEDVLGCRVLRLQRGQRLDVRADSGKKHGVV